MIHVQSEQIASLGHGAIDQMADDVIEEIHSHWPGYLPEKCGTSWEQIVTNKIHDAVRRCPDATFSLLLHYIMTCSTFRLLAPNQDPDWLERIISHPGLTPTQREELIRQVIDFVYGESL